MKADDRNIVLRDATMPAAGLQDRKTRHTTVLYVSANLGNDSWDGLAPTQAAFGSDRGPLATLEHAVEILHRAPSGPTTLFVRTGTYRLASPLELSRSDVTVSAFPSDALPLVTGARTVGPWRRSETGGTWVADWPGAANFSRLFTKDGKELASISRDPVDTSQSLSWAAPLEPCRPTPGGGRPTCPDRNKMGFIFNPIDLPDALLDAQPVSSLRVWVESAPFEETLHTVASINRSTHVLRFGEPDAFPLG
jgi:hypothetical protein